MANTSQLMPGEHVAYSARPHLLYFSLPAGWGIPIVLLLIGNARTDGFLADAFRVMLYPALAIWVVWTTWHMLQWFFTRFTVTNYRVIWRVGVVARNGVEIPLDRVSNVNFKQSILERILGAGDLMIESSGQDGQSKFTDIRHPDDVQLQIHQQIANSRPRPAASAPLPAPAATDGSLLGKLRELEDMHARGSLSDAEFESAKNRLLG